MTQCPICDGALEQRDVAPCFDCGHMDRERECLANGDHEYHWYRIYGERVVLCDFCDADFDSYYPEYLGLPEGLPQQYPLERLELLSDPGMTSDSYCPDCGHRLAFLTFLHAVRAFNSGRK